MSRLRLNNPAALLWTRGEPSKGEPPYREVLRRIIDLYEAWRKAAEYREQFQRRVSALPAGRPRAIIARVIEAVLFDAYRKV